MVIELSDRRSAETVVHALDAYKTRLRAGIERSRRQLTEFEQRYGVTTDHFLSSMAAEDMSRHDLEYVEWAGEARMLEGLETELRELQHARYHLS
jgi:hypothetical protein